MTRAEVVELLVEGFIPRVGLDEKPAANRAAAAMPASELLLAERVCILAHRPEVGMIAAGL
jgi:hypothetical protein